MTRQGRRTNGWRRRLRESSRDETAFFEALRRLEKSVDRCPEDRHLIHSDLHPNVLVDGSTVTGLLDWGCSLYGDFVYDHAWLAFWAPWYPAANGIDFARESLRHLRTLGIDDDLEHRMLCCQVRVGLDAIAYNVFTRRAGRSASDRAAHCRACKVAGKASVKNLRAASSLGV